MLSFSSRVYALFFVLAAIGCDGTSGGGGNGGTGTGGAQATGGDGGQGGQADPCADCGADQVCVDGLACADTCPSLRVKCDNPDDPYYSPDIPGTRICCEEGFVCCAYFDEMRCGTGCGPLCPDGTSCLEGQTCMETPAGSGNFTCVAT